MQNEQLHKDSLRDALEVYLTKWKLILLFIIFSLISAFIYLRYTPVQYQAHAIIKIKDDKDKNKLPEISSLQNYGLFKTDLNNMLDEIEVIKSRTLVTEVIKDLKFNVQQFVEGRIKDQEVYNNPPLNINFSTTDSILYMVDTTLQIKINSATDFLFNYTEQQEEALIRNGKTFHDNGVLHDFGESIETGFGSIIITPNIGKTKIGSKISIKISPINKIASGYREKLRIETTELSSVVKLTINDNVREKAQLFLEKLIEKYNEDVVNDKRLVVETTSNFINKRLEIVSSDLEKVDFTAENLQKSNRLTALATQSNIYIKSERENEDKLITTSNQIQLIDYMQDHLSEHNTNADLLPADIGIADNSVTQITKNHNDLVLQRNRILKSSSEKNPTVINLNNQISALKNNLDQSLNNIKSANKITLNTLSKEKARISAQIYSAPTKERQYRDVKRQQDIKESLYLYLLQKREELAIILGVSSPNAKIIDAAYALSDPVAPKKKIIVLVAIILGLFFPLGIIYLSNLLDTTIHNKNDLLSRVSAPYIGDIPKSSSKKKNRLVSKVDYSPKAEAFRMMRTNIDFLLQNKTENTAKTIFVTSTISQEGKSHTSINLATSLSFSEKKVLLVETDIRVPKIEDYLNVKNKKGITDFICDDNLTINDVTFLIENNAYLDVIPSGAVPPNPAELLMSPRVKFLFEKVKKKYDYIIVDTAAVGLVTDTLLISQFADMFIYVVSVNKLDKRQLHIAQTMYEEKRLPNMSILLNGTTMANGYGYGYGSKPKKKKWFQFSAF